MENRNLSCIHPDAKIAENVIIGPFVTIEADVEIGEGTEIQSGAVILNGSRIGKNCRIHSGAVIGGLPQDLKFRGEKTYAIIGNNTVIREFATICFERQNRDWRQLPYYGILPRGSRLPAAQQHHHVERLPDCRRSGN